MKQKRTYVTLLLIVALLCLGIAYAAVTNQTLTISGSAGVTSADTPVKVEFTKAEVKSKPAGLDETAVTATVDGSDAKKATISVSEFKTKGDTATIEYTITNQQTDIAATVETPVVKLTGKNKAEGTASGWFTVTCEIDDKELAKNNADGNAAEASTKALVTVTLNETPVTADQVTAASDTIEITITAKPVESSLESN